MKVTEILHEGPAWDRIKNVASNVKAGIAGAQAGYAQSKGARESEQRINKIVKDAEPNWFKAQAAYQQRNVAPTQMGQYLTQWARQWFDSPAIPDYASVIKSPQVTPLGARQYLRIAASHYVAPDLNQEPTDPAQPGNATQPSSTSGTITQTPTGQAHAAAAINPNQPTFTVTPKSTLFQDPAAFKAEFDKYMAGTGNGIPGNTELKDALKSMWLELGGTKVESVNKKLFNKVHALIEADSSNAMASMASQLQRPTYTPSTNAMASMASQLQKSAQSPAPKVATTPTPAVQTTVAPIGSTVSITNSAGLTIPFTKANTGWVAFSGTPKQKAFPTESKYFDLIEKQWASTTSKPSTPTAPSAAPIPSTNTVFDNPAKLASDFKSYIGSGGKVSPQFINVLKNALLTGFKVVEHKNKSKKTIKESRVSKFKKLFETQNHPAPWLLCESTAGKNAHLEHLEDLLLDSGYTGATNAFTYLDSIRIMLSKGAGNPGKVTTKWDGAPAIICGIDPDDGKFFLGTKSVFAKDAKLIKSNKDVDQYYSDKPGLAKKLKYALKYLPELGIGNVLQGDLMFTDDDLGTATINNEECYVFTPNTITYAVPVNSKLGATIRNAKIGIVFHTAYEGTSLPEMTASFGVSVAGLNTSRNVWFDDATYKDLTGRATLTPAEDTALVNAIAAGQKTLTKLTKSKFDIVVQNAEFAKYIKPFINNNVRSGDQVGDPLSFLKKFTEFYSSKQQAEIAKLKGGPESKAALERIKKIQQQEQFIANNSNTLLGIMAIYKKIIEIKLAILRKLQQVESLVGTFIKTETGYKVVNPEGFVAIGHDGGAVKLVDRLEFSRQNFAGTQDWKRQQIISI